MSKLQTDPKTVTVHGQEFEMMISAGEIHAEIGRLAQEITRDFADRNPVCIVVLNGAFVFAADLLRAIQFDTEVSFIKLSSYRDMQSSGKVTESMGLLEGLAGRDVIVFEDIVDTGHTIAYLHKTLMEKGAGRIAITALLYKSEAYQYDIPVDYFGFEIPNRFVIGYGLDYNDYGRTLADVYVLKE